MTRIHHLHYVTKGLAEPAAFEIWKEVLSPLFEPQRSGSAKTTPSGSAAGVIIGGIIIARVMFNAQSFVRDEQRIQFTPDHILFHLYTSGGFSGTITNRQTSIGPGQVALIDLACAVNTRAFASNTISLIVPRKLLSEAALGSLKSRLDDHRNGLLAAHMISLRERSAQLGEDDVDPTIAHTVAFLERLLDPDRQDAQRQAERSDDGLLAQSEALVRDNLAQPDLSPDWLADELRISRASLYRLFGETGGIMRYVQERRLLAVRAALSDPLETRRLARLAAELGFNSGAHFSRSFRARFGIPASAYRKQQEELAAKTQLTSPEIVKEWWIRAASL
jgi:AraC-like DNA-binding protein